MAGQYTGVATLTPIRPVAIVGPTASGKTALSLNVAREYSGEIVNVDSMQLYRGMDIGTAKLGVDERRGIPHHLLDIWDVTHTASVAEYERAAVRTVEELRDRSVLPVLVGGSMMYIQSLIDQWKFPPTDPAVRAKYMAIQDRIGPAALHERLAAVDPQAASIIEPNDPRRTVRALEVIELTGRPFAASQPPKDRAPRWNTLLIGLSVEPEWISRRIEERTRSMFRSGLVDEVASLVQRGLTPESTAGRAIGYAQVLQHLRGDITEDEACELTIVATRRYVRRQRSWLKRDPRIRWVDADRDPWPAVRRILDEEGITSRKR